jgi:hypothetical protein
MMYQQSKVNRMLMLCLVLAACESSKQIALENASCSHSIALQIDGKLTGYEKCSNGLIHRKVANNCPSVLPRERKVSADSGDCSYDKECNEKPLGQCEKPFFGRNVAVCVYGCSTDADCETGEICECGNVAGICIRADCRTDRDCPNGKLCAATAIAGCPELVKYACQNELDECAVRCNGGKVCSRGRDGVARCTQRLCTP